MVMRNAGKGRGETSMTTSFLHVIPDDDIARTDKAVVITETNAVIKAVGMEMNSRTGITQLLSQVRLFMENDDKKLYASIPARCRGLIETLPGFMTGRAA